MTNYQRAALKAMAEENLGAIVTKFGWTWPQDIRESDEKALEVLIVLGKEAR